MCPRLSKSCKQLNQICMNRYHYLPSSTPPSRNFQQPVAVATDVPVDTSPAPNTYNLSGLHTGKNSLVSAEAAFKSRSQRGTLTLHGATNPAPGQYSVRDDLLHRSTCGHKAVFDSRSQREAAMKPVKVRVRETGGRVYLHVHCSGVCALDTKTTCCNVVPTKLV